MILQSTATVEVTPAVLASTSVAELQELVANIARKCPALESRAAAAALILMSGKCKPLCADRFVVDGCEPEAYSVDLVAETCSCKDFQYKAPEYNRGKFCKHLLSAILLNRLARKTVKRETLRRVRLVAYRPGHRVGRRAHVALQVA